MPVETLERPAGAIRIRPAARRRRPLWPTLLVIALVVLSVSLILGKAEALIAAGVCGVASAALYASGVSMSARKTVPARGRLLFFVWMIGMLLFSLSFIASGARMIAVGDAAAERAGSELTRTVFGALLLAVWWLGVRLARWKCKMQNAKCKMQNGGGIG